MAPKGNGGKCHHDGSWGDPVTMPGRAVTIWRKDAGGVWRCVVDIVNDPPAPSADLAATVLRAPPRIARQTPAGPDR